MSGSVVLVGLSGSGKSTVARLLAPRIGLQVVDTDRAIEEAAGRSVAELFASEGEARFRDREARIVAAACNERAVIATGGGAVLREENRRLLRQGNLVVWLDPPLHLAAQRLAAHGRNEVRPLLQGDLEQRLQQMDAARRALYAGVAHLRLQRTEHGGMNSHQAAAVLRAFYEDWWREDMR